MGDDGQHAVAGPATFARSAIREPGTVRRHSREVIPMKTVGAVVIGILVWFAWDLVGSVVAELLAPIFRPLRVLVRPPLGRSSLLLVWASAAGLAWLGVRDPASRYGIAAFVLSVVGLIMILLVRDGYREARGLPAVRARFPAKLSPVQRIGLILVAAFSAATGTLMFFVMGPSYPET